MNDPHPHEDELDVPETLPPAVLDALRQLDGPARIPPPALDEAVLSGARQHFKQTARNRAQRRLFLFGGAGAMLAAAAAIAVAFVLTTQNAEPDAAAPMASQLNEPNAPAPALPGDLNADGQTDIADAMLQARAGDLPQAEIDALCYALVEVVPPRSADLHPQPRFMNVAARPAVHPHAENRVATLFRGGAPW